VKGLDIFFKRNVNLPSEEIGGEMVVLDADNDIFFSSNAVGLLIWRELSEPRSLSDLCATIVENFEGADYATVQADVTEFVDSLVDRGLARKVLEASN